MTWHFTKNKKETIAALLHDVGTPCFAHCIDYVFGDYLNQESSERKITDIIKLDEELLKYLDEDEISLLDLEDFNNYPILENKSPNLCTDRLDGVLHTCYIWLKTHLLEEIKEVYDNLEVLTNESNKKEIGFTNLKTALKFVKMIKVYALELQGNKDKFVMKYISDLVKEAAKLKLITIDDLYFKKEQEIINIFETNFKTWPNFTNACYLKNANEVPKNNYYISFATKKRNVIPLIKNKQKLERVTSISKRTQKIYFEINEFQDKKYGYIENIKEIN